MNAVGAAVTPITNFTTQNGNAYRNSTALVETVVSMFTTVDGSALTGADYSLRINISCGDPTGDADNRLTLSGFYILEEVSAIN